MIGRRGFITGLVLILGWVAMGIFTAGALNASFLGNHVMDYVSPARAREKCAALLGMGLAFGPIGFVGSPFATGFFQYGWTLTCKGNR